MSTKGVGRPKEGNPEETRRAILRAAVDSFARAGFIGATTRNVALQAGVNVATLHYHYGSKEGLYRAVWGEAFKEKPAVNGHELPARERLLSVLASLLEFSAQRPWISRLALQQLLSPVPVTGGLPEDSRVSALRDALATSPGTADAISLHADPEDLARRIVALLDATVVSTAAPGMESIPSGFTEATAAREAVPLPRLAQEAHRLLEVASLTLAEPGLSPGSGYQEGA